MNKLLIVSALLLSASSASAGEYRLVNADNSVLSSLCIMAVESRELLNESAKYAGMDTDDLAELRCNGKPLPLFLSRFRTTESSQTVTYVFNKKDGSELTELCYAAVRSAQEFAQVKETYFADEQNIEEEVSCNGVPLKDFARKYRNQTYTASAQ